MTRKHFKLIADIISKIKNAEERKTLARFAENELRETNPRFDREKFFKACNIEY